MKNLLITHEKKTCAHYSLSGVTNKALRESLADAPGYAGKSERRCYLCLRQTADNNILYNTL